MDKKEHGAFDLVDAVHDASKTGDWDNAVKIMHEMSQESVDAIRNRIDKKVKEQRKTWSVSEETQFKMPIEKKNVFQMNMFELAWHEFKKLFNHNKMNLL